MGDKCRLLVLLVVVLFSSNLLANELTGVWENKKNSVQVQVRFDDGVGIARVVKNADDPKSVGKVLFKNLRQRERGADVWHGLVYAKRLKKFVPAKFVLSSPNELKMVVKVRKIRRTVFWSLVDTTQ